jgi:hypothetical protein
MSTRPPRRDRAGVLLPDDHPLQGVLVSPEADCVTEVAAWLKDELAAWYGHREPPDSGWRGPAPMSRADLDSQGLVDFTGAPHGGAHKLLPEWQSQARITPTTIIDHTIVGEGLGAYYLFRDQSGLESHFIVHGRWGGIPDGTIWQLMSIDRRADANNEANGYAISIETGDDGSPADTPWTAAEVASLRWLHNELAVMRPSIRRRKAISCTSGGLGYHAQMGAPSCWTPVAGKTCPARDRIDQWNRILVPAFVEGETDMPLTDGDRPLIREEAAAAVRSVLRIGGTLEIIQQGQASNDRALQILDQEVDAANSRMGELATLVAELAARPAGTVQVDATAAQAIADALVTNQAFLDAIAGRAASVAGERLQKEPPAGA